MDCILIFTHWKKQKKVFSFCVLISAGLENKTQLNSSFKTSSIRVQPTISILKFSCLIPLLSLEIMILSKPNFSASEIRWSTLFTGRISPDKPTSADKQKIGRAHV